MTHNPSATFLQKLPAQVGSYDRVLLFSGTGSVRDLLPQAESVLEDSDLLSAERWETVTAKDGGDDVVYIRTKSDAAKVADTANVVDFSKVTVQTTQVCFRSIAID